MFNLVRINATKISFYFILNQNKNLYISRQTVLGKKEGKWYWQYNVLILSQTSPGFLRVCSTSLLKTLLKKEKLLVTKKISFYFILNQNKNLYISRQIVLGKKEGKWYWQYNVLILSQTSPGFYVSAVQVF